MTDILKIAEKAVPLLDELDMKLDVWYRLEMTVKKEGEGSYIVRTMTMYSNPAVSDDEK